MSSAEARATRAPSSGRAAGRYQDADAASIMDYDEDVEERDDGVDSDIENTVARRPPAAAEPKKQAPRPGSHGRQPSLNGPAAVSSGRSNAVGSRRDSGDEGPWREPLPLEGTGTSVGGMGLQTTSLLQHSSGSSSNQRRHPNGLPARQPAGPIPGMSYLSELVSRYPIRQAPSSGPQVALVSGQLYVSDRLREAMVYSNAKKSPTAGEPRVTVGAPGVVIQGAFPTPEMLIPTYASDGPFATGNYMQQRRAEKEQRAFYTGQSQPPVNGRPTWPFEATGPGPSATSRAQSAATATRHGGGGTPPSARQRDIREGVERWLESNEHASVEEEAGRAPALHDTTSSDPSLVYRQYGILRTYGKQHMQYLQQQQQQQQQPSSRGLWPTLSVTPPRTGHRVGFEQKRTSSGAGGGGTSPKRSSSQPACWPPSRPSAY